MDRDEAQEASRELRPSRSEMKRQAERLTQLGARLSELSPKTLAALEIDEELNAAIETCKTLKRGGARARQVKRIGKLLRARDTGEILAVLDRLTSDARERAAIAKVRKDRSD